MRMVIRFHIQSIQKILYCYCHSCYNIMKKSRCVCLSSFFLLTSPAHTQTNLFLYTNQSTLEWEWLAPHRWAILRPFKICGKIIVRYLYQGCLAKQCLLWIIRWIYRANGIIYSLVIVFRLFELTVWVLWSFLFPLLLLQLNHGKNSVLLCSLSLNATEPWSLSGFRSLKYRM